MPSSTSFNVVFLLLACVYIVNFFFRISVFLLNIHFLKANYIKMASRKLTFSEDWLLKKDNQGALIKTWAEKKTSSEVFCNLCLLSISYLKKGLQGIVNHSKSKKHIDLYKLKLDSTQTEIISNKSDNPSNTIELSNKRDAATKAEFLWVLKNVATNFSFNSNVDIASVFHAMFPGGVPADFSLGPTKCRYILTEALSPYFNKMIVADIGDSYFNISYDETTNNEGKKELQIMARYWSLNKNEVVVAHIETMFLGHATAVILVDSICKALDNANLQLEKVISISSDGPNVNQKVFRLINEKVKSIRKLSLLNLGTCQLHVVHNSFVKGIKVLENDISTFVTNVHRFFKGWPARCEDLQKIQDELHFPNLKFIKHVESRWLSLEPAVTRILEQWDVLLHYFLKFIPKSNPSLKSNFYFKNIIKVLEKGTIKAELYFIISTVRLFVNFSSKFQGKEPLIHFLHSELCKLIQSLANRILSHSEYDEAVGSDKKMKMICEILEKNDENNFIKPNQLQCGQEFKSELAKIEDNTLKKKVATNCISFFKTSCLYLIKKSIVADENNIIKHFRCLNPIMRHNPSAAGDIRVISQIMPFQTKTDSLFDEWKCMQAEVIPDEYLVTRIENYWKYIFDIKTINGNDKYPNIIKVVKAALSLWHGNADIERGFSISKRILTEDRASMSVRVLNARLLVKSGLMFYGNNLHLVPITKELLALGRAAHSKYKLYLEEEKRKKEASAAVEKEKFSKKREREEENEQMKTKKLKIAELEVACNEKKNKYIQVIQVTEELLATASVRLEKAIKDKDMVAICTAQSLLQASISKRQEEIQMAKEVTLLQTRVEKKKSGLISDFFKKKCN